MIRMVLALTSILLCGRHISGVTSRPHEAVQVKSCSDVYVPLYQDKTLTTLLPNPMYSDAQGNFSIYVTEKCVRVSTWSK